MRGGRPRASGSARSSSRQRSPSDSLAARGRILGLFLMTGAGVASLWLGREALAFVGKPSYLGQHCGEWVTWLAWGRWETFKAIVGFVPAAVGSLLCFTVFLGPMVRFLRNRAP